MPSQRYKLIVAYRGTNYHGWQAQALTENYKGPVPEEGHGIPTIQGIVARAVESVNWNGRDDFLRAAPGKTVGSNTVNAQAERDSVSGGCKAEFDGVAICAGCAFASRTKVC